MVFSLWRSAGGNHLQYCGYYETDATEDVIEEIVNSIKKDNKLPIKDFAPSVVAILRARGYTCEEYKIRSFGYTNR